jgi:hypothetical protein
MNFLVDTILYGCTLFVGSYIFKNGFQKTYDEYVDNCRYMGIKTILKANKMYTDYYKENKEDYHIHKVLYYSGYGKTIVGITEDFRDYTDKHPKGRLTEFMKYYNIPIPDQKDSVWIRVDFYYNEQNYSMIFDILHDHYSIPLEIKTRVSPMQKRIVKAVVYDKLNKNDTEDITDVILHYYGPTFDFLEDFKSRVTAKRVIMSNKIPNQILAITDSFNKKYEFDVSKNEILELSSEYLIKDE